jgi:hypothetical protein
MLNFLRIYFSRFQKKYYKCYKYYGEYNCQPTTQLLPPNVVFVTFVVFFMKVGKINSKKF